MNTNAEVNIGIIGCGSACDFYQQTLHKFDILNIAACADVRMERAYSMAKRHNISKACTVEEILADPSIDIIVNFTIPQAHAEISQAVIEANKALYSEKPFAVTRKEGRAILDKAKQHQVRVGCAPDTFLGRGIQTCIKLINEGHIGTPFAATAFMAGPGPETWHPDPEAFYLAGGGPLFDMGPYYLTALVAILGPIRRVAGIGKTTFPERHITSKPKQGQTITVKTPTHVIGSLEFVSGLTAPLVMSFDILSHNLPHIEIYGTEGSLRLPDPNSFHGPLYLKQKQDEAWVEVPLIQDHPHNFRGIGLADFAYALRLGRPHRASGELAFHILDVLESVLDSSEKQQYVELTSICNRPQPLNMQAHLWNPAL